MITPGYIYIGELRYVYLELAMSRKSPEACSNNYNNDP